MVLIRSSKLKFEDSLIRKWNGNHLSENKVGFVNLKDKTGLLIRTLTLMNPILFSDKQIPFYLQINKPSD